MKILIINQILYTHSDGVIPKVNSIKDTMIYQMCRGFKSLGHEVTLAAGKEYMPVSKEQYEFEIIWFKSDFTKFLPATLLPYSKELRYYLKNNHSKYDLVISKEVFSISSLWASRFCPNKTVLWVEQANHQRKFHQLPSKIWFNIVAKCYVEKDKAIVPCSERARVFLKTYFRNTTNEIVEHGIDIKKFAPAVEKKLQVIVSSQLIKRKNIDSVIRIFARFHRISGYQDVKLLIAGRGPEEMHLKRVASEEGIDDCVEFLGFITQSELNRHVSESLAFLINTKADMNMVSVPESVCSCTPLIMNEIPLNSWYVKMFSLGIVKNNWDEHDMIDVIKNNAMYVDNCKHYRERLSLESSARKLIEVFKQV